MFQAVIGRSLECDVVVNHAHVSSVHAALVHLEDGRIFVRDLQSTNGVYVNSLTNRVEEAEVRPDDIIYLSKRYSVPVSRLLGQIRGGGEAKEEKVSLETESERIRIGRSPDNDVVIPRLGVSKYHAEIRRLADGRCELVDLGTTNGTFVNNRKLVGASVILGPDDRVEIGGMLVSLQVSRQADKAESRVGVERQGLFIETKDLVYAVGSGQRRKELIRGVDLALYPGEFVGLMGPSGCGKTTLMNLLIGNAAPTSGQILFNGVPLRDHLDRFAGRIGYVPQDDLLHPELTVREVLYYNARLKLPLEVSDAEIFEKIDRVCERLNLYRPGSALDVRDVPIGSPDKKGISGGQKKRVSLAIELLGDPEILFLDEPTSGLSSKDTKDVMVLLRRLTEEQGISVVITIHQPSLRVYELLDRVMYLKQGRLCYFGPAFPDSIQYFDPAENPYVAGPDAVMEKLDEHAEEELAVKFRQSSYYETYVGDRLRRLQEGREAVPDRGGGKLRRSPLPVQFLKLCERYAKCKVRDWPSVVLLLAQAPVVGVLIGLIFWDEKPEDRLTVAFLLGFVALWFGVNNSAREIVAERGLLQREKRSGLSSAAYLASKLAILGAIAVGQVGALVAVVWGMMPGLELDFWAAWGICALAALAGVALGLLISSVARSQITAIVAIPLVLIPVILLGGLVKLYNELSSGWLLRVLSDATPARWSFEALTAVSNTPKFVFGVNSLTETPALLVLTGMLVLFAGIAYWQVRRA